MGVSPSVKQIEASVRQNGGVLHSFGYGFSMPGGAPEQVGDWAIRLVDRRGMGNHGSFIAVATTPRTLAVQTEVTMRRLREEADAAEAEASESFLERGDFACQIVPLLWSPLFEAKRYFLFADEKWAYFAISHENHIRHGDGRHRLWVRPVRPRRR